MAKLDAEGRKDIDNKQFAFPKQRKEPLENVAHVRNAVARFNQVKDVSTAERDGSSKRISAVARKFGVALGQKPNSGV